MESTLEELDIHLSHDDIKNLSKETFQKFLKKQIEEKALAFLNQIKLKHSKVLNIKHESLMMQEYLLPENMRSIKLAKFLFRARCRMIDVKANFGNMNKGNINCKLGCDKVDSQEHLLECPFLNDNDLSEVNGAQYGDLFSSQVEDQLRIASILEERFSRRKQKTK